MDFITPERRGVWKKWDLQIRVFAKYFLCNANLPKNKITILDAGCGIGSAIHEIHKKYPNIILSGYDNDIDHFKECQRVHSQYANFYLCDIADIQDNFDIVYISNVLEHLRNWKEIVKHLLSKCRRLYILIPYKEDLSLETVSGIDRVDHVASFDKNSFSFLKNDRMSIAYRVIRTPFAWGHPLKREVILRVKAYLKNEKYNKQRQLLIAVTNLKKRDNILPLSPFLGKFKTFVNLIRLSVSLNQN